MMARLRYENKEFFISMLLNTKNQVLAAPTISVGSLNASIVHPREIFREAIHYAAAAIILIHNHPSGDPSPSKEDLFVTEKLIKAGKLMDIAVLDHVIIGDNKYISLKENGIIDSFS
jgi:DNA repair protein RadC